MKSTLFVIFLFINSLSFGATLTSMTKKEVKKEFINKTLISVPVDNLNGKTIENIFSMFLDEKGIIFGKMSQPLENEPQTDKGVYSIQDDGTVYITWEHWDGAKKLCANFFDTQNAYIAIDCDHVFHTIFLKDSVQEGNHL
jgi:hypothetical protein